MAIKMSPAVVTPIIGPNTQNVDLVANLPLAADGTTRIYPFNLGTTVTDEATGVAVYAKAAAAITASTAVCALTGAQGAVTAAATGGAYLSPATAMATGDGGWFSKAL